METGWLIAAVDYSGYRLRVVSQPGPIWQQVLVQNQGEVAYWYTTNANQELNTKMYKPAARRPKQCSRAPFSERTLEAF